MMALMLVVIAVLGLACLGLVTHLDAQLRRPTVRRPVPPDVAIRLGRIAANRQARVLKAQTNRNQQFVKTEALRQLRDP
jgi:hypothetical protein